MKEYDVIVIGSGGGLKIALPAAAMGLKTAVIERDAVAGTCLNRGCIPSKMLIYPSEIPHRLREAQRIDVTSESGARVHFGALIDRISRTVDGMSARQAAALKETENLDFYPVHCEFISDRVLQAGEETLTAERIFVATGCRPQLPDIPGLQGTPFMTSKEALRRTDPPRRLLVLGAGYIAVELGNAYAGAGSEVEFIVRSRFLRQEDREISDEFARLFAQRHCVRAGLTPTSVEYEAPQFTLHCQNGAGKTERIEGDALLVTTGVTPCTDGLGLDNTGIATDDRGYIQVDGHLQTSVPGVYALGDCVGNYFFRHTVNYEGEYLVRSVLSGQAKDPIDYGPVPHAIFTTPEIAGVGLTEEEAQAAELDYIVGKASYDQSNAGLARGYEHGFAKLIIERPTERILGAHILGDEASNMIHLFIAMMKMRGTLGDLLDMIFIHPALPEIARDAARNARDKLKGCG